MTLYKARYNDGNTYICSPAGTWELMSGSIYEILPHYNRETTRGFSWRLVATDDTWSYFISNEPDIPTNHEFTRIFERSVIDRDMVDCSTCMAPCDSDCDCYDSAPF
jgi:hypothetical protein